jgi:hypothetical protein
MHDNCPTAFQQSAAELESQEDFTLFSPHLLDAGNQCFATVEHEPRDAKTAIVALCSYPSTFALTRFPGVQTHV